MSRLTQNDVHYCLSRLPKDLVTLMKERDLLLAGGFIRETISGGKVKDIDFFGHDKKGLEMAAMSLALSRKGARMFSTDNAFTVLSPPRLPVQFITRWLTTNGNEDYLKNFDFTVCQAGIWWDHDTREWTSGCHEDFYADLAAKRLVYTFPQRDEEVGGSMIRMKKFMKRGYDIQIWSLAGITARLMQGVRKVESPQYEDEKWLTTILTSLLREVDPLTVVDGVEVPEREAREVNVVNGVIVPGIPNPSPDFS